MNILDNLDVKLQKEKIKEQENELTELINTITLKEEINKRGGNLDPLDILTDLRGSENTVVVPPLKNKEINDSSENKENLTVNEDKNPIDKSFYTTSNIFTQSDFDDFNDLKEDVESTKLIIKVLIVLIIIAFITGIFFILNRFLGWGLF